MDGDWGGANPVESGLSCGLAKRKVADWIEMARSLMDLAKIEVDSQLNWAPPLGDRRLGSYTRHWFTLWTAIFRYEQFGFVLGNATSAIPRQL